MMWEERGIELKRNISKGKQKQQLEVKTAEQEHMRLAPGGGK